MALFIEPYYKHFFINNIFGHSYLINHILLAFYTFFMNHNFLWQLKRSFSMMYQVLIIRSNVQHLLISFLHLDKLIIYALQIPFNDQFNKYSDLKEDLAHSFL